MGRSPSRPLEGLMKRKTAAFFLVFGTSLLFAPLGIGTNLVPTAVAQMPNICPPGQTFVVSQGKCVAAQPAVRCPEGQEYDTATNRCVTPRSAVRCPEGQEYDTATNRCVTPRSTVRCPQGQQYDATTNRCVTAGMVPGLPNPQR